MKTVDKQQFQYLGKDHEQTRQKVRQLVFLLLSLAVMIPLLIYEFINYPTICDTKFNKQMQAHFNFTPNPQIPKSNYQYIPTSPTPTPTLSPTLTPTIQQQYKNFQITQHNLQNAEKQLGELYAVRLQNYEREKFNDSLYGIADRIQVASVMDHSGLSQMVDFGGLEKRMIDGIAHQVIRFRNISGNQVVKEEKEFIEIQLSGKEGEQIRSIAKSMNRHTEMSFGKWLTRDINNPQLRLLQYLYFDKKYGIGQYQQETPICIYSASYNIYSKNRFKLFFESIARQNYSNYHIVYIDDNSPDGSAYKIAAYLNSTNTRVNSRISIVHNLQRMGALANMFFWIKKYCAEDSIVVTLDGDDSLFGTQTFQVLNSVYKDQNIWYVYSKYLNYYPETAGFQIGYLSESLQSSVSSYRTKQNYWVTSHLRTFRQKLMKAVPIEHFIEYHYDNTTKMATPRFYGSAADRYEVYSQLELAGDDRVLHISDPLYLYDPAVGTVDRKCYHEHELHEQYKSRIKTPLQRLPSLSSTAKLSSAQSLSPSILQNLSKTYAYRKLCNEH